MKVILAIIALSVLVNPMAQAGKRTLGTRIVTRAGAQIAKKHTAVTLKQDMKQATYFAESATTDNPFRYPVYERAFLENSKSGLKVFAESRLQRRFMGDLIENSYQRRFINLDLGGMSVENRLKIKDLINKNRKWLDQGQGKRFPPDEFNSQDSIKIYEYEGAGSPHAIKIAQIPGDDEFGLRLARLLLRADKITSPSKIVGSRTAISNGTR